MDNLTVVSINKPKKKKLSFKKEFIPWLFVIPGILFTLFLKYYPILQAFKVSFFQYNYGNEEESKFIGFDNYANMFKEGFYKQAWINTAIFLVLIMVMTFFIPIIQAIFLNELVKTRKIFTIMYIIPAVIPVTVTVLIWKLLWNPDYGFINVILQWMGFEPKLWLSDLSWVKFCIVFPGVIGGGVAVLMYLAAIMGIPQEIVESAQIDGCVGFRRIFYITLPNIKFLIVIQVIMSIIGIMQYMNEPFMYTSGGPAGTSTTMGLYIYKAYQDDLQYGRACAASVVLLFVIVILTVIQMKLDKSETE